MHSKQTILGSDKPAGHSQRVYQLGWSFWIAPWGLAKLPSTKLPEGLREACKTRTFFAGMTFGPWLDAKLRCLWVPATCLLFVDKYCCFCVCLFLVFFLFVVRWFGWMDGCLWLLWNWPSNNTGDYVTPESGTFFTHEHGRSLTDPLLSTTKKYCMFSFVVGGFHTHMKTRTTTN